MSRIGTFGASQMYLSRIMATQQRLYIEQQQVATEKKSANYTGIATDANRLINFENSVKQADQFVKNNGMAATRLNAAQSSLDAVQNTIKQFSELMTDFAGGNTKDPAKIKTVQEWAVQSMIEMQSYLNVSVDGQYLFSGGRVSTRPIDLPATSLSEFQKIYDGDAHTFPTTRAANLQDMALSYDDTGTVTFNDSYGAIIPANAGAFANVATGSLVSVGGTLSNNKTVSITGHVATNTGGNPLAETANAGNGTFITYYGGTLPHGTTGNLAFGFDPDGNMTITPGTANTLASLTEGSRFTISGSNDSNFDGLGDYDGAYVVTKNANGVITLANDTTPASTETVAVSDLSLSRDSNADTIPDAIAGLGAISGDARFTISGNTVTLTVPSGGTALNTLFSVGDFMTIDGTSAHDGTFEVTGVNANTVSFQINPDALRTSKFVPQTGRTDVEVTFPGQTGQYIAQTYGSLSFVPNGGGGETITANTVGAFTDVNGVASPKVGEMITVKSQSGVNDGVYKVVSNDGTSIVVESNTIASDSSATATFSSTTWYKGDTSPISQRIDSDVSVDLSLFASDPAFEKAYRAMGLIAQGITGTTGGLDNNQDRIAAARYLLADALESPAPGKAPYGTEQRSDIESLQSKVGVTQSVLKQRNEKHAQFMALFQARADDMENMDKTLAVTQLLDDQRALEASYQTLSSVRSLSLLNYMK